MSIEDKDMSEIIESDFDEADKNNWIVWVFTILCIARDFVTNEKINALRMLGKIDEAIAIAEKLPCASFSYEFS